MKTKTLLALLAALTPLHAEWKPIEGHIMTRWAKEVTPENAWTQYPRPQLQRENWTCLNGLWDYQITAKDASTPADWAGEILVPFAPEAALSGVGKLIQPDQTLWYHRKFSAKKTPGKRTLIHFEAIDYQSTIYLNGKEIGSHTGGFTPTTYDLTPDLKDGDNELVVQVHDSTGDYQLLGKQRLKPEGIWYTRVSGIWQTVWMEEINDRAIEDLDFTSNIKSGTIGVRAKFSGTPVPGEKIRVTASINGKVAGSAEGESVVAVSVEDPQLWSPDAPNLYDLKVELLNGEGKVIDQVKSYTALRELGKAKDKKGNWRFTLNGKFIFHWGPLDQGWWPDGLLTPPTDEAMLSDIQYLKDAGFNMIRKHIKVEPRRYYYYCDKLGMMMWQDQVSADHGPAWTRMAPNPKDADWPDAAHEQWVTEYKAMVDHLRDHPSIVVWSPFNEAWGQHRTEEVGEMAAAYDLTRPINIASGGNFWPVGDIADQHAYPDPNFPVNNPRFKDYIKVVGEFGGHGWAVKGHLWDADKDNWGYGGLPKTMDEWKERYTKSINVLRHLRRQGVAAGVYTQTTDVEGEINGLLTYDRVEKVPASWLKPLHEALLNTADAAAYFNIAPTSEAIAQSWKYTTDKPDGKWQDPGFDDAAWKEGKGGFGTDFTPNTKIGTEWKSSDIWLRREFEMKTRPKGSLLLRIHHDEDATVFINGVEIANLPGHTGEYTMVEVSKDGITALKRGKNILAIHVKQTNGGQYIDAGLVDEVEIR
ncbi:glycoside hydrolase family 2 [Luteolibacter pohnpeiensis]|uniref:Glycoside hydrolase family 2 n=1 Tax=Luteolibacter pohnpeiensis TaxID=454153 RepID=A0A934S8W5_9BACT|nr:sugar-binding domain-containing protein [Luteolibacter pohnpeiensis]MBK1881832.1 glycoside hydrolase family 2 [Luteolibacter pohnpeiensis]